MGKSRLSGPLLLTDDAVTEITDAAATIDAEDHGGLQHYIALNRAAGIACTLPAATGSGKKFTFVVVTTASGGSYVVKVANATDVMIGQAILLQDSGDTMVGFETAATSDTITLNGTTTGGVAGAIVECIDIASGKWHVSVRSAATGVEATPFSATVA